MSMSRIQTRTAKAFGSRMRTWRRQNSQEYPNIIESFDIPDAVVELSKEEKEAMEKRIPKGCIV